MSMRLPRRALLLCGASFALPSLAAVPASGPIATPPGTPSPAPAPVPASGVRQRPLVFPSDFGAHPDTRIEWWYITGALEPSDARAGDAASYGFQVTFFRARTNLAADHPSRFAARQLHFAHVALTDVRAQAMRHDQRIARGGFAHAAAAEGDTRLRLGQWTLERDGAVNQPRYRTRIVSDIGAFSFDFSFRATQPVLLQGDAGFSRKGPQPEQASHYYSLPQLVLSGQLVKDGKRMTVKGQAWLDHEWSNAVLHPEAVGWDWIGMNLDNGSALTAFRLRRADGSALYASGSFRRADGAATAFEPDQVRFTPGRLWRSAASGGTYPVAWSVDTPAGRFNVVSLLDNQELDSRNSIGAIYWEGLSELRDTTGRRIGRGYLEMTGYAAALRL